MSESPPPGKTGSLVTTSLLAVSIVFLVLANVALALRLYARKIKSTKLGWDDCFLGISLVRPISYLSVSGLINEGDVLGIFHQYMGRSGARRCQ